MSETPALQRPRQVTVVAWMIIVGALIVVVSAFDQVASLRSLDTREAISAALADPATRGMGLDVQGAIRVLRAVAMVTAACAAAMAILGYYVLGRHRGARVGLTVLAVPVLVGGMLLGGVLPGGSMALLVAVPVVLLWLDPARDWFNGIAPRPPQQAEARPTATHTPPTPPTPPPPPASSAPRPHQGFGSVPTGAPSSTPPDQATHSPYPPYQPPNQGPYPPPSPPQYPPQHPPQYPPPPPGAQPYAAPPPVGGGRPAPASWTRPSSVLAACLVTWICSALAALLMGSTIAVVLASPQALVDEMNRQDPDLAAQGLGTDSWQASIVVLSALVVAWSLAAIVLAVLVFRRTRWARYALLGSAGGAAGLCIGASLQFPFFVVPLLACVVTFSLLLRADVRDWFARSPSNP